MKEIGIFYDRLDVSQKPSFQRDLHANNPALIPSIPEFEPIMKTKRTNIHYVGPLQWDGFEKEQLDIDALFPESPKKPLVYISLGGSVYSKHFYQKLIDGFSKQTDWNVLMGIGPNFPASDFETPSKNIAIRAYLPGLQVCEHADVIVNTGGHGTVMQALWNGKPVVAIPHNIDQATIASRLVELGLGINLNKIGLRDFANRDKYFRKAAEVDSTTVVAAVRRVMADKRMRAKAEAFKKHVQRYEHPGKTAADLVEKYARS